MTGHWYTLLCIVVNPVSRPIIAGCVEPYFSVVLYHGSKQERQAIRSRQMPTSMPIKPDFPVVVTSFEIIMADRKFLQKYQFKYLGEGGASSDNP